MEWIRFRGNDILLYYERLPKKVKAFSTTCDSGYAVVINSDLSPDMAQRQLAHELMHIENNDLESDEPVEVIEGRIDEGKLQCYIQRIKEWMEVGTSI